MFIWVISSRQAKLIVFALSHELYKFHAAVNHVHKVYAFSVLKLQLMPKNRIIRETVLSGILHVVIRHRYYMHVCASNHDIPRRLSTCSL